MQRQDKSMCSHWCRRWGCNRIPKTLDLANIRKKYLKIRANLWKFGQNVWKPSQNCCMCFDFSKMAPKIKVQTILWWSCFYLVLFGQARKNLGKFWWDLRKHGVWSALIWKNAPNMKWNAVVFLFFFSEFIFFGVYFGQFWGNLGKHTSQAEILPVPTPVYVTFNKLSVRMPVVLPMQK